MTVNRVSRSQYRVCIYNQLVVRNEPNVKQLHAQSMHIKYEIMAFIRDQMAGLSHTTTQLTQLFATQCIVD